MRRPITVISLVMAVVGGAVITAWAVQPVKVVDSAAPEVSGAREAGWLAYSRPVDRRWTAFVVPDGGTRVKIPNHKPAFVGSIELSGPRANQVVFWEFEKGNNGQIRFFDLVSSVIKKAPSGVNTSRSEEAASMSGDYLLFGRGKPDEVWQRQVILYRFSNARTRVLAKTDGPALSAERVNGNFAVWTRCTTTTCDVYRHQISTGRTIRIPSAPKGRANYWSTVTPEGVVYYVEGSAASCGVKTKLMRFAAGTKTKISQVPDGVEIAETYTWQDGVSTRVLFTRTTCNGKNVGIYEVTDAVP
jgi:hypothetical protein